jgi:nucleotide-binding universal stress UspA family protein
VNYASLLAYVNQSAHRQAIIETAFGLSATFNAHLTALHVHVPIYNIYASYYGEDPPWDEMAAVSLEREQAHQRDATFKSEFEQQAQKSGAKKTEWRYDVGELAKTIALHARYADLVLMGQPGPDNTINFAGYDTPAQVALLAARPVLVLPHGERFETIGRRVTLAWNGSREATRAVTAALPLLAQSETVNVVVVGEASTVPSALGKKPGADIALYLARHGINAPVSHFSRSGLSVGETLLSAVADQGADTLCMGAYGRSRLSEFVFGGATYELMRHMTVPTLIAC